MLKMFFMSVFATLLSTPAFAQWPFFDQPRREYRSPYEPRDRYAPRRYDYDADRYGYNRFRALPPERKKETMRPEPERDQLPEYVHVPGKSIIVFRASQQYAAFNNGVQLVLDGVKMRGPVSTGALGYRTPLTRLEKGPASIEFKQINYVSNTYPLDEYGRPGGGAEMPYAMFWDRKGGYALHAGKIPQWNGEAYGHSKGCVRLPMQHAQLLYERFSGSDVRVIIAENVMALYETWEPALAQAQAQK